MDLRSVIAAGGAAFYDGPPRGLMLRAATPMVPRLTTLTRLGACAAAWALVCAAASGQPLPEGEFIVVAGCRLSYVDAVSLAAERRGVLADIARPGDAVAAGQHVARLRDAVLRAGLAIAEREASNDVEVRFAAKAAELAEVKYDRAVQANRRAIGTVSEIELRELRLAADRAVLQLEEAQHRLGVAGLRLEEIRATLASLHVTAPFAARVRAVYKQPGEVVQEGEVIAELVNTERVRVEGDVELSALPWIAAHGAAYVRIEGNSIPAEWSQQAFAGVITFVDVKVEPVSKKVHIAAEIDNRAGFLREGLPAVMLIPKTQSSDGRPLTARTAP